MRTWLAIAVVVAQVAVLGFMAGQREWIVRHGRTVSLRTAPIDPHDPMRGEYVSFDYEIAHIPQALCRGETATWFGKTGRPSEDALRDRVVYVAIAPDDAGVAELCEVSDRCPADESFLRARVVGVNAGQLDVRFGAEALFVQQGKAADFEKAVAAKAGVPVDVDLAVSRSGIAVMKGYRWEPLGLTIALDRAPPPEHGSPAERTPPRQTLRGLTVELKNHGDKPVAIVALPEGRSFRLLRNERWGENPYEWAAEPAPEPSLESKMVRVLAPGETYREHIDLMSPHWFVRDVKHSGAPPLPMASVKDPWTASFRLEYAPPMARACAELPNANLIVHSRIRSRAFAPLGAGVD